MAFLLSQKLINLNSISNSCKIEGDELCECNVVHNKGNYAENICTKKQPLSLQFFGNENKHY